MVGVSVMVGVDVILGVEVCVGVKVMVDVKVAVGMDAIIDEAVALTDEMSGITANKKPESIAMIFLEAKELLK